MGTAYGATRKGGDLVSWSILRINYQPESVSTLAGVRRNCKSEGLLVWPTGAALLVNEEDRSGSIILGQF